jgi:beta-lactamase class A
MSLEHSMELTRRHCLFVLASGISAAADRNLYDQWRRIAGTTDGVVGAAALHLSSGRLLSLNGDERFPLASVCKLPIAMNMLALVDEGKLALSQKIEVLARDVVSSVSDIAARWAVQHLTSTNRTPEYPTRGTVLL